MWFYGSIFAHLWTHKWNGAKWILSIKKKLHYVNYLINHKLFLHFSQMSYKLWKCWWMLSQLSGTSVWGIQPFRLTLSLMKNSMINDFIKLKSNINFLPNWALNVSKLMVNATSLYGDIFIPINHQWKISHYSLCTHPP
jgi:hypothetical protein